MSSTSDLPGGSNEEEGAIPERKTPEELAQDDRVKTLQKMWAEAGYTVTAEYIRERLQSVADGILHETSLEPDSANKGESEFDEPVIADEDGVVDLGVAEASSQEAVREIIDPEDVVDFEKAAAQTDLSTAQPVASEIPAEPLPSPPTPQEKDDSNEEFFDSELELTTDDLSTGPRNADLIKQQPVEIDDEHDFSLPVNADEAPAPLPVASEKTGDEAREDFTLSTEKIGETPYTTLAAPDSSAPNSSVDSKEMHLESNWNRPIPDPDASAVVGTAGSGNAEPNVINGELPSNDDSGDVRNPEDDSEFELSIEDPGINFSSDADVDWENAFVDDSDHALNVAALENAEMPPVATVEEEAEGGDGARNDQDLPVPPESDAGGGSPLLEPEAVQHAQDAVRPDPQAPDSNVYGGALPFGEFQLGALPPQEEGRPEPQIPSTADEESQESPNPSDPPAANTSQANPPPPEPPRATPPEPSHHTPHPESRHSPYPAAIPVGPGDIPVAQIAPPQQTVVVNVHNNYPAAPATPPAATSAAPDGASQPQAPMDPPDTPTTPVAAPAPETPEESRAREARNSLRSRKLGCVGTVAASIVIGIGITSLGIWHLLTPQPISTATGKGTGTGTGSGTGSGIGTGSGKNIPPPPPPPTKVTSVEPQEIGAIQDIKGACTVEFNENTKQFTIRVPRYKKVNGRTQTVEFGIDFHVKIAPKGKALEPLNPKTVQYSGDNKELWVMFAASEEALKAGGIEIQVFSPNFKKEFGKQQTIEIVK